MISKMKAGIIMVNSPVFTFTCLPFGGYKQSGFARELVLDSLDLYLEAKSVLSCVGPKPLIYSESEVEQDETRS